MLSSSIYIRDIPDVTDVIAHAHTHESMQEVPPAKKIVKDCVLSVGDRLRYDVGCR